MGSAPVHSSVKVYAQLLACAVTRALIFNGLDLHRQHVRQRRQGGGLLLRAVTLQDQCRDVR